MVLPNIAKLLCKWQNRSAQLYDLGGYYHESRKINQSTHTSIVAHVTKHRARALGRGDHSKNSRQSLPQPIHKWWPYAVPATHLGRRMGTASSASTLGDLKATRKRQSSRSLVIWNLNMALLRVKEYELVEEAKRYSLDVLDIFSTKRCSSNPVELDDGWKLF